MIFRKCSLFMEQYIALFKILSLLPQMLCFANFSSTKFCYIKFKDGNLLWNQHSSILFKFGQVLINFLIYSFSCAKTYCSISV